MWIYLIKSYSSYKNLCISGWDFTEFQPKTDRTNPCYTLFVMENPVVNFLV